MSATKAGKARILELLAEGYHASEVARLAGVSRQRVHQVRTGYQSLRWYERKGYRNPAQMQVINKSKARYGRHSLETKNPRRAAGA